MADFHYKAFISYSWADDSAARWLHRALETYRMPAALIGTEGRYGRVPARLAPVFKDRDEEAAGANLSGAIAAALSRSEWLVVICSPRAAASVWVNREIAWFKINRDPDRILALIIDGEPGDPARECFPVALTQVVASDLTVTDAVADAPLAADLRDQGDGRRRALLKLAAAMLGVGLDDLIRRDERRRVRRARAIVTGALALALTMSVLAGLAVRARDEARRQRAAADGLVEFMLTDLRQKLEPVGRLDALDVVGQRALAFYAGQRPDDLDADALGQRSRALHLVGEVRDLRGDRRGALAAFRAAAATTAELLARDPNNGQRVYDHAQSLFWVGEVAHRAGDRRAAEAAFAGYKRLAQQLVAIDPRNVDWQMELSYAESNLGVLFLEQQRYAEAVAAYDRELAIVEAVARRFPADRDRQLELASALSSLSRARRLHDDTAGAAALLVREVGIYRSVLAADANNAVARRGLLVALSAEGTTALVRGDLTSAATAYREADAVATALLSLDPSNSQWLEFQTRVKLSLAEVARYHLDNAMAAQNVAAARANLARLRAMDGDNLVWNTVLPARLAVMESALAEARGDSGAALASVDAVIAGDQAVSLDTDPDLRFVLGQAMLQRARLRQAMGQRAAARQDWQQLLDLAANSIDSRLLALRWLAERGLGIDSASTATELDRRGFRHPIYTSAYR